MEAGHPLDRAVASTNSGITIADATRPGFPLMYVNAAFERLTGYTADEVLGRNCRFLQGPGTDPDVVAEISNALREQRETGVVLLNYRKDGLPFFNELRLAPVRDDDGRCIQIIGVQNDVSRVVNAQRALEAERDRMQRSLLQAGRVIARQDQELAELRVLQDALTPIDPPRRPHLDVASLFVPAESGVAGDFFLIAPGPHDATVVVVGDVIGHGLEAARRATYVRAALATFARFTDDPLRLLEMANHSLIERTGTSTEFVTAVCAAFRPAEATLAYAVAGHPPPVALDTGEPLGELESPGMPLGIEIDLGGTLAEVPLSPGEGVLLYTDGLIEARSPTVPRVTAPRLGDERVREVLAEVRDADAGTVVDELHRAAAAHTRGRFADDLCIVAARATGA